MEEVDRAVEIESGAFPKKSIAQNHRTTIGALMRFFNTAGPVNCHKHYCLPPLSRLSLDEIVFLIDQEKYFVLHAPRQTGKTTCLLALMDYLNRQGKYRCLYFNVEAAQTAREDVSQAMDIMLREMASRAQTHLNDPFPSSILPELLPDRAYGSALNQCMTRWSAHEANPPYTTNR